MFDFIIEQYRQSKNYHNFKGILIELNNEKEVDLLLKHYGFDIIRDDLKHHLKKYNKVFITINKVHVQHMLRYPMSKIITHFFAEERLITGYFDDYYYVKMSEIKRIYRNKYITKNKKDTITLKTKKI